ncbi:MAG: NAD(P)H-dependent oxidoreductase [Thalassobaculales bacterium]
MSRRILLIDGHPDPDPRRFVHALAAAYAEGAAAAGHELRRIEVAGLDFPLLRTAADWESGAQAPGLAQAQAAIAWADHLVILYPLWLGGMPALLKGFLEQVLRPGFAVAEDRNRAAPGLLTGKSARLVVTMGMPALVYRWFYFAHSLRALKRNILKYCGVAPVADTLVGGVAKLGAAGRARWLARLGELGRQAR